MRLDPRRTVDPRSPWDKLRRRELVEIAHANGHTDITAEMPADDYQDMDGKVTPGIRTLLRQRGVRPPNLHRPFGAGGRHETKQLFPKPAALPAPPPDEWAEFQRWKASQQKTAKPQEKPKRLVERPRQEINLLRDECKRLGIKMDRRDGKAQLKAKIEARKANGQNSA